MKILGVELAPLSIPMERRLQTFAIVHYTYIFLFMGFGMVGFFIYLLFTRFYFIPLLYAAWYYYDRQTSAQGGRRSKWVRNWHLHKHFANYFPITIVKTADYHPSKNYIFGLHPHGIMCHSHFCNMGTEGTGFSKLFPAIKPYLCVLAGQFMFPIFREYFLNSGAIEVSRASIEWVLTKEGSGNAVGIIVGGAKEALDAVPGRYTVNLRARKGFVRLALKHGASLVPVFSFGENNIYTQVPNPEGSRLRQFQEFLTNKLGFSPPVFHGRGIFNYTFGLLPYRRPIHTIFGKPIDIEKVNEPTKEQVDELHERYVTELTELFEAHKLDYGAEETSKLVIH
ncbi:2-acylglycerol O-acyltransferase 2-like [Littorina saxatilis]|uniref:Acyltransferase n=1 Tax=Littorina saxatilis TaxID=31220 RepID=A0AAN9AN10_9CAEN